MKISSTKHANDLADRIIDCLSDIKAEDINQFDLSTDQCSDFDTVIITTGRSDRHTKAIVRHVVDALRDQGIRPFSIEGEQAGRWILIDLGDVVLHVMQREARQYYQLEKIWDIDEH